MYVDTFLNRCVFAQVSHYEQNLASAPIVLMDGNIPADTMSYVCDVCHENQVPGLS